MKNADLCFLWFDKSNRAHFQDTKVTEDLIVQIDKRSTDCKFINFVAENDGVTRIIYERKFDTCDKDDYVIEVIFDLIRDLKHDLDF